MFAIGNVIISNRVLAAPLAGVSDRAFRIIAKSFGCGLVTTEMVSDMGLVYGQEKNPAPCGYQRGNTARCSADIRLSGGSYGKGCFNS